MAGFSRVEWPIDGSVKFPERCLFCDGPAPKTDLPTELTRKFGRLLVRLRAPLCAACRAQRSKRRVAWVVAFFAYVGIVIGGIWLAQRTGFSETHASLMFFVTCVFAATCFGWFVYEEPAFLRRHTRIWIEGLGPKARSLFLATRDATLVGELRGIVEEGARKKR
jgi:hypothetical protein